MKIGKDLDLFDGPLEEYKYETYDSQLPESIVPGADTIEGRPGFPAPDLTEDGMVDMMESLGWNVSTDNILVVPDGDSKIIIRNLNREQKE